jgi:hypothetical protein
MGKHFFLAMALLAGATTMAPPARAGVDVAIAGNTATADIDLGGVGAELILTFDDATSLSAANLGIDAQLVNPLDAGLLARLPTADLTSLPSALPLLITVEPPNTGGFSLRNTVRVELHTHALPYTAGSAFRLFKAPLGGAFRDITDEVAPGSVRTRGTTGGFSQFLVLVDLRGTSDVIAQKFTWLRGKAGALSATERTPVLAMIDAAEAAVADGRLADAIASLDSLRARVSARSGTFIPNAWSPLNRNGNVAGELLAGAATLKFSVGYLRDYGD